MTVEPRFKPDPIACVCGCSIVGPLRRKAWQDGLGPHVRGCTCRRCIGSRQRGKASTRERRIAKDAGGTREIFSGALSGIDGRAGLVVWEESAQLAVTRGLRRWWNNKGTRDKLARLYGRPGGELRAFIASDEKPWLVVMEYEDWVQLVQEHAA